MNIFGQPKNYSEMLQRIFYTSLASGLFCTFILAKASPDVKKLIDSISIEADIGVINNLKVLYVLIPAIIVVVSRIIKLHDRISDLFKIRVLFDTKYLLFPLALGVELELTKDLKERIHCNRVEAMYAVFYPYAGFENPIIDEQLVRTSADNWGWFWVLVESLFLFVVTTLILVCLRTWIYVSICLVVILAELFLLCLQWIACKKNTKPQVAAILGDLNRKNSIAEYFRSL